MNLNPTNFRIARRTDAGFLFANGIRLGVVVLALVIAGLIVWLADWDPVEMYMTMFEGSLTSQRGLIQTLLRTVPLLMCALGIALAAKMTLWNIGAEGQLHLGAVAAAGVAMWWSEASMWVLLPSMAVAGALAGALWILFPALAKAYWGTNEIITTLLLNFVGINLMLYLIYGPWRDPEQMGFPYSPQFVDAAQLPNIWGRLHVGILIAFGFAFLVWFLLMYTRWGYEFRVTGESQKSAEYAGMSTEGNIILVLCIAGALAGLAGMLEVSGYVGRLQRGISNNYGYTAIIVAFLGQLHPIAIAFVSVLFGALEVGGLSVRVLGIPVAVVNMIQGIILFCAVAGEFFIRYKLIRVKVIDDPEAENKPPPDDAGNSREVETRG